METAIVSPKFKHLDLLEEKHEGYQYRAKPSIGISVSCDVSFGTNGCLANRLGWCNNCCVTIWTNTCTVSVVVEIPL
ncbi:MAG: hypothetical protein ACXITV_02020 [Luteibaculaceae bacterium]